MSKSTKKDKNLFIKTNPDTFPIIQEQAKEKYKMQPSSDDFIPKTEEEVIRVPDCTYANDSNKNAKYFLCPCSTSSKGFEPICEACAKNCHKNHHPTLEVPGMNQCFCGLNNHQITQEMEDTAKEKIENAQNQAQCFYSKFFEVTPNKGYFKYEGTTYCAVCVEYCLGLKFDDANVSPCEPGRNICYCPNFHEVNVIKLNADFISRRDFKKHLRNFNFNILFKISKSKQMYVDTLINQINQYTTKKNLEQNREFFKNFIIYKILELFSAFSAYWENKFFHVVPSLLGVYKIKDLFNLMSLNELTSTLDQDIATNFISAKFYFAEILYNSIVKVYMLKYNNLWNIRTIINMNLYQRFIYIHNIKNFSLLCKEPPEDNYLDELVSNILDLYDNILKINERFPVIFEKLLSYVFPTFNRIMKYLIKYNIMNDSSRKRYFDLVLETLLLQNEKKKGTLKNSCFYFLKCCLYSTIYITDKICIDYLKDGDLLEKRGFVFQINEESLKLNKIFLLILKDFDRKEDVSKTIIFDYYVRKFLELMMDKEDFYLNCLYNLTNDELNSIINSNWKKESTYHEIINSFELKYYDQISILCTDLNNINRQYFSFECDQENYFQNANEVFSKFHGFLESEGFNLNEIENKYNVYNQNEIKNYEKLQKIKKVIFYSTFFQKIEEFIHIYSCSKKFPQPEEGFDYNRDDLLDNVRALLKFLYLISCKDPSFMTLIMNIKPSIFAITFNDVFQTCIDFLERYSEMMYCGISLDKNRNLSENSIVEIEEEIDKTYKFENFYFFSEVVTELLILNSDDINNISELIKISFKSLKKITIYKSDFLNAIEEFGIVFRDLASDEILVQKIKKYFNNIINDVKYKKKEKKDDFFGDFNNNQDNSSQDDESNKELVKFIPLYYNFLSDCYENDIDFYDYFYETDIINLKDFDEIFNSLLNRNFKDVQIDIEFALCRYFFIRHLPLNLKITNIEKILKNLYNNNIENNIDLIYLMNENNEKTNEILNFGKILLKIFENFDIKKLSNYNDKNINFYYSNFPLKYYEFLILRPLFNIINIFILNCKEIFGKDIFIFYQLIFYFLKITIEFYSTPQLMNKNYSENYINNFEEFTVKSELTKSILDEIFIDAQLFSENKIKYFELEKIYKIFLKNIERIINFEKEEKSEFISKISIINDPDFPSNIDKYLLKKLKLIETYKSNKEKTYDNNLSIIEAYNLTKIEIEEKDVAIDIVNYLQKKLFDNLTDLNIRTLEKDEINSFDNKEISDIKFQNIYILIYLNDFFYNDSLDFQMAFLNENIILPENFFQILIEKIIVASALNEVKKLYYLDYLENVNYELRLIGRNETISFSMGKYAIKFIQNLCEGHNQEFQSIFFDMKLDPEKYLEDSENKLIPKESSNKLIRNLIGKKGSIGFGKFFKDILTDLKKDSDNNKIDNKIEENSIDTKDENDDDEIQNEEELLSKHISFFNLICYMMQIITNNLHIEKDYNSKLFKNLSNFKNYENILELYTRFSDLIIEMIQGTSIENFNNFYMKNLPEEYEQFLEDGEFIKNPKKKIFIFLHLSNQIKLILFDKNQYFNPLCYDMKINLFTTINNILSQENIDESIVKAFIDIFPPDNLINIISLYLRGIYLSHLGRISIKNENFEKKLSFIELNQYKLDQIKNTFKTNPHLYEDDYFKLASQMFLFLLVSGEKYNIAEAQKILKYAEKDIYQTKVFDVENVDTSNSENNNIFFSIFGGGLKSIKLEKVRPSEHNKLNDYIVTVRFFTKIIKKCEFKTQSNDDKLVLKIIYFIVDPHFYYVSKNNIDNFFNDVDRSSSTTKLKSLIEELNLFMSEVEYKTEVYRKRKYVQNLLTIDYKNVDFYNFCISLLINLILLIFLTKDTNEALLSFLTKFFVSIQILMNIIYLIIFLLSKYGFYVLLNKNAIGKEQKLTIFQKIKVYIFDSFFFNDEIYLLILIIIAGIAGLITRYGAFLFALQLLSVIKFIDTIKEMVLAFKIRFSQLVCMIGFLAILIFFYANFGFYFLINEFNLDINGSPENFCQTLSECSINYFNHGVRAGGGIGDIIEPESFDNMSTYYLRWTSDLIFYITVILLLLNMINGVIVSTFSQIREESNQKEEDINNKCFICNIERIEFEKKKIDFMEHQKYEHNLKHYIKFFVFVKRINEKDLDADQSFIIECLKNNDIKCFPVNCSKSVGNLEENEENNEDNDETRA